MFPLLHKRTLEAKRRGAFQIKLNNDRCGSCRRAPPIFTTTGAFAIVVSSEEGFVQPVRTILRSIGGRKCSDEREPAIELLTEPTVLGRLLDKRLECPRSAHSQGLSNYFTHHLATLEWSLRPAQACSSLLKRLERVWSLKVVLALEECRKP
jgi:hypothetical protein